MKEYMISAFENNKIIAEIAAYEPDVKKKTAYLKKSCKNMGYQITNITMKEI